MLTVSTNCTGAGAIGLILMKVARAYGVGFVIMTGSERECHHKRLQHFSRAVPATLTGSPNRTYFFGPDVSDDRLQAAKARGADVVINASK